MTRPPIAVAKKEKAPAPNRGGAKCYEMVLAILRFHKTALDIDSMEKRPSTGERMDVILVVLIVALGAALFVYLSYTVISRL
jgi:hypothetical protein